MDEQTIGELVSAVGHMDADGIAELIRSSSNASAFEDPELVAAFLASRATSPAS
jgi:hypothetical protein